MGGAGFDCAHPMVTANCKIKIKRVRIHAFPCPNALLRSVVDEAIILNGLPAGSLYVGSQNCHSTTLLDVTSWTNLPSRCSTVAAV